jgi:hypothetical protein
MSSIPVNLPTEDELSEVVLFKILEYLERYAVGAAYRHGGFGYLRRTISGWNHAAKSIPFVVLTDLDQWECPSKLINGWLNVPRHPNLLFRVAVREVEAWLLADPGNLSLFLGVAETAVPRNADTLADAKAAIIDVARKSRSRAIRERMVPRRGSTAKQGPDYNSCLGAFVTTHWDIEAAQTRSRSLARTINRLAKFKPVWT